MDEVDAEGVRVFDIGAAESNIREHVAAKMALENQDIMAVDGKPQLRLPSTLIAKRDKKKAFVKRPETEVAELCSATRTVDALDREPAGGTTSDAHT